MEKYYCVNNKKSKKLLLADKYNWERYLKVGKFYFLTERSFTFGGTNRDIIAAERINEEAYPHMNVIMASIHNEDVSEFFITMDEYRSQQLSKIGI